MKTVFIIFILLTTWADRPKMQDLIIQAVYVGVEEGIYTFIDDNELEYQFLDVDLKASKKYDLDTDKFVGKKFEVTYWMDTEIDENDKEYDVYIIVSLDLLK